MSGQLGLRSAFEGRKLPRMRSAVALFVLGWGTAASLGCGASMRTVVESDMRFEHCYRIDDDGAAPAEAKRGCWHDWVSHYTRGQDRNRVDYAKERLRVLSLAPVTSPVAQPSSTMAGPKPSSPYAPPPAITPSEGSATSPSGWPPGASTAAVKQQ